MVEHRDKPHVTEETLDDIVEGLVRTGREIDDLTATLGTAVWKREQLMFLAWTQGINVRLIARLAKCSRTTAQQVAERHARDPKSRRQDRGLSTSVERIARDRGLLDDDVPFYRRGVPLGEALGNARLQCGMSQGLVARLVGIDLTAYSLVEAGRRHPSWGTMVKIANVLSVNLDELAKAVEPDDR